MPRSASPVPGARFLDPAVLARIGNLELLARRWSTASSTGCTARRTSARRWTSPSTAATCRATTSAASTGGCSGAPTASTSRSSRPTPTRTSCVLLDVSKSMGFGARITKLDYARTWRPASPTSSSKQRDRVGLVTFDEDIVDYVPPSAKHLTSCCTRSTGRRPTRPGQLRAPLRKLAEHFGRRGIVVVISDLYEEPEADASTRSAPLRGRGNDLIVFHVLDPAELDFPFADAVELRGPGERRAASGRARRAARAVPGADPGAHRGADRPRRREQRRRLRAVRHLACRSTTRSSTTCRPRATDADAGSAMSFLAPLFLAGLAALAVPVLVHLIQRERKNGRRVPVADVPAAHPVRVGAAPAHPQLAPAARCAWRRSR